MADEVKKLLQLGEEPRAPCVVGDPAPRNAAEEALRKSEERFTILVESVTDYAIFMLDTTGRIMTWNIGARRIKGYQPAEIIGQHFSIFYTEEAKQNGWPDYELETAKKEGRFEDEGWRVRRDGTTFWASVIITAMHDREGRLQGFSKVTRDLTERKRAEQLAERRAQLLGRLASDLANAEQRERRRLAQMFHDQIQQPLVASLIKLNTLKKSANPENILKLTTELEDVLGQAVEVSRSLAVDLSPPILREAGLARSLHWLASWMHDKFDLRIDVLAEDRDDPRSESLRFLMFDTVKELLLNIVKHAQILSATVIMRHTDDGRLSLRVEDPGAGFEPTLDAGLDSRTGIGLLSIRERVEACGGAMVIESAPGHGTVVILTCPDTAQLEEAAGSTGASAVAPPVAGAEPIQPASNMRVLVVDDHPIVRRGLVELLTGHRGVDVVGEAANGAEAVELAGSLLPDVIVMDVNMPVMGGIEATRRIKKSFSHIAVIGLSFYTEAELARSMKDAGAFDYLSKSASPETLVQTMRASIVEANRTPE